jgi:excinuclease ABC subunit C
LERKLAESAGQAKLLDGVAELFGLPARPERIEVYDNSHIMGSHALGAFIVATPEGFDKRSYRTFNITDASTMPGDDYAMMREVFRRRFKGAANVEKERRVAEGEPLAAGVSPQGEGGASPPSENILPDLVLIDGGLGQLHAVQQALQEIGVQGPTLVAIAKGEDRHAGREWFLMEGRAPFQLPVNDPLLHYLQRLRDEAHRFAIGRHRKKRSTALTTSVLDDIPGIGPTRKRALLQHFGSRADVERATLAELEKVTGISKATARSIYDYFHG